MNSEEEFHFEKIFTQHINADWLTHKNVLLDVLRLDAIHKTISGNKWFKLKYYLEDARQKNITSIATFGGAYSNHIVATAFTCKMMGLKSLGIIRGEEAQQLSHTLIAAKNYGMRLVFVKREEYKIFDKNIFPNVYWIPEGGYGEKGVQGAEEIFEFVQDKESYTHIVCAVGTGTTLAGIIKAANPQQEAIGISVMKNNFSLGSEISDLLNEDDKQKNFRIIHHHHFGGYAKHTKELLSFMNETWQQHQLQTDFVYTAKTFFSIKNMIQNELIPRGSRVLMVHTGGLQGDLSLPPDALQF